MFLFLTLLFGFCQSISLNHLVEIRNYTHDRNAFTEGLFVAGTNPVTFFESTGLWEKSDLRIVDLESGKVKSKVNLDSELFAEGISICQGKLFQLTYQNGVVLVYKPTDALEGQKPEVRALPKGPQEGWGMTTAKDCHDSTLYVSDGSDKIYLLNSSSPKLDVLGSISVKFNQQPVFRINELEWIDGVIYANLFETPCIVAINPQSGDVTQLINAIDLYHNNPSDVMNGIAYDESSKALYVTGKNWPVLFQVRIEDSKSEATDADFKRCGPGIAFTQISEDFGSKTVKRYKQKILQGT